MVTLLNAEQGSFSSSFTFYLEKKAPVSHQPSLLDYHLTLCAQGAADRPVTSFKLQVLAHSLCPCSKTISIYGAHNQRSLITVQAETKEIFSIKELISLIEHQASSELYNLLKRVDEKYVTEKAYENPKFSEDIVRDVYLALKKEMAFLTKVDVSSEHLESIHTHNAFASIHDIP
jgi:GTP cyclohydrolase I